MEDLFPLLVFAFFILASLFERIMKGGKKGPGDAPPPGRDAPPPKPYQRRSETVDEDEDGSAADMLPDDLWAILTGETRPRSAEPTAEPEPPPPPRPQPQRPVPQRPAPQRTGTARPLPSSQRRSEPAPYRAPPPPLPVPQRQRPTRYRDEAAADEEYVASRPMPAPERFERVEYAPQDYVREIPKRAAPAIVSMETPLESDAVRHGRFHDRRAGLDAPATVQLGPQHIRIGLDSTAELRRAIIIREILGPPKSLE
ncbi:MAG TPA: hypothetical protein VMN60_13905 [Longimicrobiales bacterium]|nr:hypothetical protein [Longimicrobiales bacterium]